MRQNIKFLAKSQFPKKSGMKLTIATNKIENDAIAGSIKNGSETVKS